MHPAFLSERFLLSADVQVADMNDAAHLSEGQVERLLEKESLALNMAILRNRCESLSLAGVAWNGPRLSARTQPVAAVKENNMSLKSDL